MLLAGIAEKVLSNGLKIICLRKTGTPIVSVQVWYRVGSAFEQAGIRGISHFLEHMMFRGSAGVPSEEHSRRINDTGGHCNAFTAEDVTTYTNSVPAGMLDMVLDMEADRMDGLLLDPVHFETERSVIIEEYHTYMNNPVAKAFLEFREAFYGNHPYGVSPLGRIEEITSLSLSACRDYYARLYRPDNAVVVVVGDVDTREVFTSAERHFSAKRSSTGGLPSILAPVPPSAKISNRHMTRSVEFDVPILVTGYPAPPSSHEDAVALEILLLITAGGETSRLHREIVRRQSVAVMVGGMNNFLKASGMSMFFAAFTPDIRSERVERVLDAEIGRLGSDGITHEEMDKIRNTTITNRTFELYSADHICQQLGYSETIEGNYRLWVERMETLKNLDAEKLTATARRWWNDGAKRVLLLKPRHVNPLLYVGGFLRRAARHLPFSGGNAARGVQ
jgi:zinc protease